MPALLSAFWHQNGQQFYLVPKVRGTAFQDGVLHHLVIEGALDPPKLSPLVRGLLSYLAPVKFRRSTQGFGEACLMLQFAYRLARVSRRLVR